MEKLRPLLIFFIFLSMGAALYAQKVSESPRSSNSSEVKLRIVDDHQIVEIFPNPAEDYLNINLKDTDLQNVSFQLYDIIGNEVKVQTQQIAKDSYRIPVEKLHMGYYVLIISDPYSRYKKAFKFSKR